MNFQKVTTRGKYMRSLVFSITLLMVLFLCITSFTLYYNSQKTIMEVQQQANKKVLYQINYNLENMNGMIKNLAISLFFDKEMVPLMYSSTNELEDIFPRILKLESLVNSLPFLDSVLVFNGKTDHYYSTNPNINYEEMIKELKNSTQDEGLPKKLVPISISIKDKNSLHLFSYFMYQPLDAKADKVSGIVLNVKPEWIFDNIKLINNISNDLSSKILIMENKGNIFYPQDDEYSNLDNVALNKAINDHMAASSKNVDNFPYRLNDKAVIVTYLSTGLKDWKVVIIQSKADVLSSIIKMRDVSLISIGFFIILAIFLSVVVSRKLYNPIQNLYNQMAFERSPLPAQQYSGDKDEFSFIANTYHHAVEEIDSLNKEGDKTKVTLRNYYVRRLLTDSHSISDEEIKKLIVQNELGITMDVRYLVAVVSLDSFKQITADLYEDEIKLYKFAIANIAGELLSKASFQTEIVEMRNDQLVFLISISENDDVKNRMLSLMKEIQTVIHKYYKITLTIALSEVTNKIRDISEQYNTAFQNGKYRLVFGKQGLITSERALANNQSENKLSSELEKRLIEALKSNHEDDMQESLIHCIEVLSTCNYATINHSLVHMLNLISQTIAEINVNRIYPMEINVNQFYKSMLEEETLEEIKQHFLILFDLIMEERKINDSGNRNFVVIDTVKEIIESSYMDLNLNLQGIATLLKMSSSYLGRVFKKCESISVAEYINEVRLRHAAELLENQNCVIEEIWEQVGFGNRSYFYKLFKSKYGTTPREYRLKKVIS